VVLPHFPVHVENRVCLSYGVQVTCAAWLAVMRIVAGVGDLVQRPEMVKHRLDTRWPNDRKVG
jgi:hypothetical protein